MKRKRSRIGITSDILSVGVRGAGKTAIVYSTNLNFVRGEKYLDFLLKEGLMRASRHSAVKYKTTKKGLDFLRAYEDLKEIADL